MNVTAFVAIHGVGFAFGAALITGYVRRRKSWIVARVALQVSYASEESALQAMRILDRFGLVRSPISGRMGSPLQRRDQIPPRIAPQKIVRLAVGFLAIYGLVFGLQLSTPEAGIAGAAIVAMGATTAAAIGAVGAWALKIRARKARMLAQLPTVLEFIALSVYAGESLADSISRIGKKFDSELARVFHDVDTQISMGTHTVAALRKAAREVNLPDFDRFVEMVQTSLERGTPLVTLLTAHAEDMRVVEKRRFLESAGRREIAMMAPLVFLILPVTVLFALWPGFIALSQGLSR